MTRLLSLLLLPVLATAACSAQDERQVSVQDAWVRLPAVAGRPGAAYFTIVGGLQPVRLVKVESEAAGRIELHASGMHRGMMRMKPLANVNLPPRAPVRFRPGGNHAMLFGLRADVQPGSVIPLTFRLSDGTHITGEAQVIAAGDPAPE